MSLKKKPTITGTQFIQMRENTNNSRPSNLKLRKLNVWTNGIAGFF